MIAHRGLDSHLAWAVERYLSHGPHGAPLYSSVGFDLTITSLLAPIAAGKTIDIIPADRGIQGVADELAEGRSYDLLKLTPSHLRLLTTALEQRSPRGRVACLVVGGEALPAELLRLWRRISPASIIVNSYGPTETTVSCCTHTVWPGDPIPDPVPIGTATPGVDLRIVDGQGIAVPAGEAGELLIRGIGVADGYLGRPDLTAAAFVPTTLADGSTARMYRSGDLVRRDHDDQLHYLGRIDDQVKIRGYRVEPAEVTAAVRSHPAVREAAVIARPDASGTPQLAAYLTAHPGRGAPGVTELRAHLADALPDQMIPVTFTVLDAMPLTTNGKVDRDALPVPDTRPDIETSLVAPRTPTEMTLAAIWSELLGIDEIGVHDNFFELGGHSLLTMQVLWRLQERLSVDVPLSALLDAWTLEDLAAVVDGVGIRAAAPIVPVAGDGDRVLSHAQERLWFISRLVPDNPFYNVGLDLRLTGPLDEQALAQALTELVRRHPCLRTRYDERGGRPVQIIQPPEPVPVRTVDLSGHDEADRAAALNHITRDDVLRPFELSRGRLLRVRLIRLSPDDHVLLMTTHHIAVDGWSKSIVCKDLAALYQAFWAGRPAPLPELPVQYADFANWQRNTLSDELLDGQLQYWRRQLAGLPASLDLPTDRPRPPIQTYTASRQHFVVPPDVTARLQALSRTSSTTMFMTMLAAFQLLLHRYAGQTDIPVGSPVAGRSRAEMQGIVGPFVNTLVMRGDLTGDPTFTDLLERIRRMVLGALSHQDLPFERIVEDLQPVRDMSRNPLVQVLFWLLPDRSDDLGWSWGDVQGRLIAPAGAADLGYTGGAATITCDLELFLQERPDGLAGSISYCSDLFDAATIERFVQHFQRLLRDLATAPDRPISRLEILGPEERSRLVSGFNATEQQWPDDSTLHELFEAQADRLPEAAAVVFGDLTLSYRDLDRRANQLARYLRTVHRIGPESLVGICVERGIEQVIGTLGILKAGAAYVPIEPDQPTARITRLVTNARLAVVLSLHHLVDRLPATETRIVNLDSDWDSIADRSDDRSPAGSSADHLGYVMHTSGTTGRPKGVMLQHRALVNMLRWGQREHRLTESDVVLHQASFAFDVSIWDLFWPLTMGARVVLPPPGEHRSPEAVAAVVAREGVTVAFFVPSMLDHVLASGVMDRLGSLRLLVSTGEALAATTAQRFLAEHHAALHNFYGPTETHVVTYWPVPRHAPITEPIPIGRPIANCQVYVLDAHSNPVPVGVVGELYLGGVAVARGYLHQPGLTAERFVPDPFTAQPGQRLYRTGDLSRVRADGTVEFLGRTDHQVKIRGHRIEPGEVEAALLRHPAVREVAVVAREDHPGDRRLVAYLVSDEGTLSTTELRAHARSLLPDAMVPSAFVTLPALPLTANQKLDRAALPAPDERPSWRPSSPPRVRRPRS